MKKFAAIILGTAFLPALVAAQDQGWAAKFFSGSLTHDFKIVAWGPVLTHKFTITNIYNVPFKVDSATVSCGCVSTKKPNDIIPPRGTAELEAIMDTRRVNLIGVPKTVQIFVSLTSVPERPGDKLFNSRCTLAVTAIVQSNVWFSAERLTFGTVAVGQAQSATLQVEHMTNPQFQVTGVVSHSFPMQVKVDAVRPTRGRVAYQVTAALKKDAPAGEFKHEIQLTTNDRSTPVLTVVAEGTVKAPLAAVPNEVDLGNVKVGEVVTRAVIIKGPGQPFKITGVEGEGDGVTLKLQKDKDTAKVNHLVTVEFVPKQAGKMSKTLKVKTDVAGHLVATITVEGSGTP